MNVTEVLVVILIVAVAFTAFLGAIGQALTVSFRSARLEDAVSRHEEILFEFANGFRLDLDDKEFADIEVIVPRGPAQ